MRRIRNGIRRLHRIRLAPIGFIPIGHLGIGFSGKGHLTRNRVIHFHRIGQIRHLHRICHINDISHIGDVLGLTLNALNIIAILETPNTRNAQVADIVCGIDTRFSRAMGIVRAIHAIHAMRVFAARIAEPTSGIVIKVSSDVLKPVLKIVALDCRLGHVNGLSRVMCSGHDWPHLPINRKLNTGGTLPTHCKVQRKGYDRM